MSQPWVGVAGGVSDDWQVEKERKPGPGNDSSLARRLQNFVQASMPSGLRVLWELKVISPACLPGGIGTGAPAVSASGKDRLKHIRTNRIKPVTSICSCTYRDIPKTPIEPSFHKAYGEKNRFSECLEWKSQLTAKRALVGSALVKFLSSKGYPSHRIGWAIRRLAGLGSFCGKRIAELSNKPTQKILQYPIITVSWLHLKDPAWESKALKLYGILNIGFKTHKNVFS